MRKLVGMAVMLTLCGCSRETARAAGSPSRDFDLAAVVDTIHIDRQTPDHALRSWWHYEEVRDSAFAASSRSASSVGYQDTVEKKIRQILTGDALQDVLQSDVAKPERIRREIVEVKNESDTRAVVLARLTNVTPIPAGATPSEYDVKRRRDGETFRYIFERDSTGWKLAQVERHDVVNDTLWVPFYTPDAPTTPSWVSP